MLAPYRGAPDFMEQPVDAVADLEAEVLDQRVGSRPMSSSPVGSARG